MLSEPSSALRRQTWLPMAAAIAFFMLLTRGSHVLSPVSLPDASLALFLFGGLYLRRAGWFAVFFVLAAVIDFGMAALDPWQGFCLTNGYWGLIPAYGVLWLAGLWLAGQRDAYAATPYVMAGVVSATLAFVISTQSYYLYSGRFPDSGIIESMRHGWEYMPGYLGYTFAYLAVGWLAVRIFRSLSVRLAN